MVAGLQQVSWRRVDVSFFGTASRFMAHNAIQVQFLGNPLCIQLVMNNNTR